MAGRNRGLIKCAPLSLRRHGVLMGLPSNLEPVAYIYNYFPIVPIGVMVRVKSTNLLCVWTGGGLQTTDQRKSTAALELMHRREVGGYDWLATKTTDSSNAENTNN